MPIINIRKNRINKLEAIKKAGFLPYPIKTKRTHSIQEALAGFDKLSQEGTEVFLTGRILSIREQGALTFLHFQDGTGKFQAFFRQDKLGEKYQFFLDNFDIGDFIEIKGILFVTKRGEKTIEASDFSILAKSLLPLPEKWHGLQDVEERFRKRYLDLIMNAEVKEKLVLRSKIIESLRNLLSRDGFLEVETPILQSIPGGALAKPFKTHLNALDFDLYLRVAPELYLKRLLVGGFEKIYEIGRCFRNEGIDKYHNPDFTMMELYWAYQNRDSLMVFVEKLMTELVRATKNSEEIIYGEQKINFKTPWPRVKFNDLLKQYCNIDAEKIKDADLKKKLTGVKLEKGAPRYKMLDELYKKECRPNIIQPTFIVDYPLAMVPLAKAKEDNPEYVDRFQLVLGGVELINGFSELNDPLEQKKRFQQVKMASERIDNDFLEALEYGMPPAAGLGLGIDRLVLLLTDSHSLGK
jgi:lysyl-tRNA synthetase class 2